YQASEWDFSYHCVYVTLRAPERFEVPRVAAIAPPSVISEMWHNGTYRTALDASLTAIHVDTLRQHNNLTGKGVIWAVVDTGILTSHPGFGSRVVYQDDLTGNQHPDDEDGHGTHVAGIIGGYLDAQILQAYAGQEVDEDANPVSPLSGVASAIEFANLR